MFYRLSDQGLSIQIVMRTVAIFQILRDTFGMWDTLQDLLQPLPNPEDNPEQEL